MDDLFPGAVSWDRCGEYWVGMIHPAAVGLLRTHVNGLREIATRRLAEHSAGAFGPLDCRIWYVLSCRHHGEIARGGVTELELLIPLANRFAEFLGALPDDGGVVVLQGMPDRILWGTVALDVAAAIQVGLREWECGRTVGGLVCPDEAGLRLLRDQERWLRADFVEALSPTAAEQAWREG